MLYLIYYENKCKNNRLEIPIYCTGNEDTKNKIVDTYVKLNTGYNVLTKEFPIDANNNTKSVFLLKKIYKNIKENESSSEFINVFFELKDSNEYKKQLEEQTQSKNVKYTISEVVYINNLIYAVEKIKTTFENGKYEDKMKVLNLYKDYNKALNKLNLYKEKTKNKSKINEQYRISLNNSEEKTNVGDNLNLIVNSSGLFIEKITKDNLNDEKNKVKIQNLFVE